MQIPFKIYYPGGNRTALVFKAVSTKQHPKLAKKIMLKFPNIEQVGFVKEKNGKTFLNMMGGEFCANAARCLAYEMFKTQNAKPAFYVSGYLGELESAPRNKIISVSLKSDFLINIQQHELGHIVNFQGISFIVTFKKINKSTTEKFLKKLALGRSAMGMIKLSKQKGGYAIFPTVYVPFTNTLIQETACGSGSIAAALVLNKLGKGKKFSIIQPSKAKLNIDLKFTITVLSQILLSGQVEFEREELVVV